METYDLLDELWLDVCETLVNATPIGSRDGGTREVLGWVGRLADPSANFLFNPVRKLHPSYAAAELLWYLSGSASIEMMKAYAPQYERFVAGPGDDGVNAYGAYGNRWADSFELNTHLFDLVHHGRLKTPKQDSFFAGGEYVQPVSQLQLIAMLLRDKPDTRQAVMTCWEPRDLPHALAGDRYDMPCTSTLMFKIDADNKLNVICTMRSNDAWLGLPYDVFCFTGVQMLLAEALGLELGWYQHQVMSLHVYDRNFDKMKLALQTGGYSAGGLKYAQHKMQFRQLLPLALNLEDARRRRKNDSGGKELKEAAGDNSFIVELCKMVGVKWASHPEWIKFGNKLMQEHVECHFQKT